MAKVGMTAGQLATARSQVAQLLPNTGGIIKALSWISDGAGGGSQNYQPVTGGTVAYRLDPLNQHANERAGAREDLVSARMLTVPYDAPLKADYRFVAGAYTYEIIELKDDHSNNVSRRAIVARVD